MKYFNNMKLFFGCLFACITLFVADCYGEPKGAKAIFESGEGPSSIAAVSRKQAPSTPQVTTKEKYIGIAYQILLMKPNGSFVPVSKYRIFRSGERIKLLVRTNRPGYLTIVNIGPTGNTNIIFNDYVEAHNFVEIPKNANLVFSGPSGTEKLLVMLSATPNPLFNGGQMTTVHSPTQPQTTPSVPGQTHIERQPNRPSPSLPPSDLLASLESAKSLRGAKDLLVEDNMKSTITVISPQNQFQPSGGKDILIESYRGVNYGVVPVSTINNGGILTLQINLTHKE